MMVTLESEKAPSLLYSGSGRDFQVRKWRFEFCEASPNHLSRTSLPLSSPLTLYFSLNIYRHMMCFIFYLYIHSLLAPL